MPWEKTGNIRGPAGTSGGASGDLLKPTDQAVSVAAQTALTGLAYAVNAAGTYHFRAVLYMTSALATTGARPGLAFTGTAPTRSAYRTESPSGVAAEAISHGQANATTASIAAPFVVIVEGFVTYGTPAAGTAIQPTMASEVAGSAVTVLAGSFVAIKKVA